MSWISKEFIFKKIYTHFSEIIKLLLHTFFKIEFSSVFTNIFTNKDVELVMYFLFIHRLRKTHRCLPFLVLSIKEKKKQLKVNEYFYSFI